VSLTLSSLARATRVFLYDQTNALRDCWRCKIENLPGLGGDALSNLTGIGAVVHEEEFHVFFVSDEELLEARSEHVSGLLILLGTDLGLSDFTSEASSHTGVNTSLLSPRSLQTYERAVNKIDQNKVESPIFPYQ